MYRVLIVEDETAYSWILKDTLEKKNCSVAVASNVKQAVTLIANKLPDVILLDIMLPGDKNGFDFLKQLKVGVETKNIPVIVLTNLVNEEIVAKQIGATSYFVKSETTIEKIVNMVKQLMFKTEYLKVGVSI